MMTKLTLRNLAANKGRFAMTTFGVVLAVSFVVSAFVLGDGLRRTFGDLSAEIVEGTDVEVRPTDAFGSPEFLTDGDLDLVRSIDGVETAIGVVEATENSVRPITPSGEDIPTQGPPQLAFSWTDIEELSPFTLVEGVAPAPGQFVMDIGSIDEHDFVVGDTYTVVTSTGSHELLLSGATRFGSDNQTLGAVLMGMHESETEALFGTDGYTYLAVAAADGTDVDGLVAEIGAALPRFETLGSQAVLDNTSAEFNQQIDIIQNVLLGFAGVSLFVSIFIIQNTFAIVLSQRTREMGLLRLVGADPAQLRRSALGEAVAVGVLASIIGIAGGLAVASGLTALFGAIGADLPAYDTIVSARTVLAAAVVGLGVTIPAAYGPARKASKVAPIVALRGTDDARTGGRRMTVAGAVLGVAGVAAIAFGLFAGASTTATVTAMAIGGVAVIFGVTLVSPTLVGPTASLVAAPMSWLGISGRLAGRNARRNSARTATTAAALMIGLAVVSMALVVGQSIKAQLAETLESEIAADFLLTDQTSEAGFPTEVAGAIESSGEFDAVVGFKYAEVQTTATGSVDDVVAVEMDELTSVLNLSLEGSLPTSDVSSAVLLSSDRADADGLVVGDTVGLLFETGFADDFVVAGIYSDSSIIETDYIVDSATLAQAGIEVTDSWLAFSTPVDADPSLVAAAVAQIEAAFPQGELETAGEFRERMEGLIDQVLSVLNALVALAVIIALIGIANTLALSVHERTREIGLVRAVGMSRRQVRRLIRYESALIAGFGAVLGVVLGIGFGWAVVTALPASFTGTLAIPGSSIATLVVIAVVAGLVAAALPARRAGRMDVLDAIAV